MRTYTAHVERDEDGKWWIVTSPDVRGAVTQVRRLEQASQAARNVIALALDIDGDTFDIELRCGLPDPGLEADVLRYHAIREQIEELQDEARLLASSSSTAIVKDLGWSMRDAGAVLGLSHQRVHQLTRSKVPHNSARRRSGGR